jgi:hypothetical protein
MKNFKSNSPCIICGESRDGYVTYHHIYTRKAFKEYQHCLWNMMPLCAAHHLEVHGQGDISFMKKYWQVERWLNLSGWEISSGKLIHRD